MIRFAILGAALVGCYRPSVLNCQYECSAQGQPCPSGLACNAGRCTERGTLCDGDGGVVPDDGNDPPGDDASTIDAGMCTPNTWCDESVGGVGSLYAVWGADANDVWAVGKAGAIYHRLPGIGWKPVASNTGDTLFAVKGLSSGQVFALGENGHVLYWDGGSWAQGSVGTKTLRALQLVPQTMQIWAAGDNGSTWRTSSNAGNAWTNISNTTVTPNLRSMAPSGSIGAGTFEMYAGATMEKILFRGDTGSWSTVMPGGLGPDPTQDVNDLVLVPTGPIAGWAATGAGIFKFDSAISALLPGGWTQEIAGMYDAFGGTAMDMWAVGTVIAHRTGGPWTADASTGARLHGIVVFANDIFVVGENNTIFHMTR